jgi:hypothetical protein
MAVKEVATRKKCWFSTLMALTPKPRAYIFNNLSLVVEVDVLIR